jgi:hypothetical protein
MRTWNLATVLWSRRLGQSRYRRTDGEPENENTLKYVRRARGGALYLVRTVFVLPVLVEDRHKIDLLFLDWRGKQSYIRINPTKEQATQHNTSMMKIIRFHHPISLVVPIAIGIMTMIVVVKGQEFEIKCSDDQCDSFLDTMVIDGCTMMASSDGSSQAFTFDPTADDQACTLQTYSDADCTDMLACTGYDVSDSRVVCNTPGQVINPCGTGIDFKIEEASSVTVTTTTSAISFMTMMLWSLLW